jgi:hypothetical protein
MTKKNVKNKPDEVNEEEETIESQLWHMMFKAHTCCDERPSIQILGWVGDCGYGFDVVRLYCVNCTKRSGVHKSIRDAVAEWNTLNLVR